MTVNGEKEWFKLDNYLGLPWSHKDRKDGWPDHEYDEYQNLRSGVESAEAQYDVQQPLVVALVR